MYNSLILIVSMFVFSHVDCIWIAGVSNLSKYIILNYPHLVTMVQQELSQLLTVLCKGNNSRITDFVTLVTHLVTMV